MTLPEHAPEPAQKRTSIWLKILGIGCGGVLLLLLIAAGFVATNWSKLTGYYQQAKSAFSDMMALQSALQTKYGGEVHISAKHVSGVEGSILGVTLVNPKVMDRMNIDSPDGRQAALDVATAARDALPPDRGYDNYEVVFQRESGVAGASMSGSWSFRFTAAELPPAKPTSR